jgi:hypothetical protein
MTPSLREESRRSPVIRARYTWKRAAEQSADVYREISAEQG